MPAAPPSPTHNPMVRSLVSSGEGEVGEEVRGGVGVSEGFEVGEVGGEVGGEVRDGVGVSEGFDVTLAVHIAEVA